MGSVSSGRASEPTASPAAAASRATTTYSARSTAAIRPGVPPTALSSPTRRIWSAIRPPTSTATLASASRTSSQPPVSRALRWFLTSLAARRGSPARTAGAGERVRCKRARRRVFGRVVRLGERRGCGRVGQLQVHDVGRGSRACGARLRMSALLSQTRPAGTQWARQVTSGYGAAAAVTATPATRNAPAPGDRITGADAERVGESGFDHHSAAAQPAALGELGLVDRGRCGVAALVPGGARVSGRVPGAWPRRPGTVRCGRRRLGCRPAPSGRRGRRAGAPWLGSRAATSATTSGPAVASRVL